MANKRRRAGFDPGGTGTSRRCSRWLGSKETIAMALNAHIDPMTEAQRKELKRLCDEADVPDKSGELLTRTGAQQMIDELRHKAAEHRSKI
jgi:DUF3072 family protein